MLVAEIPHTVFAQVSFCIAAVWERRLREVFHFWAHTVESDI
jgi:hypothetical protein